MPEGQTAESSSSPDVESTTQGTLGPLFNLQMIDESTVPSDDDTPENAKEAVAFDGSTDAKSTPAKVEVPAEEDAPDEELLKIMMGDVESKEAVPAPEGVDPDQWQRFQEFQQYQAQQTQAGQQSPGGAAPPGAPPQEQQQAPQQVPQAEQQLSYFQNQDEYDNFFSEPQVANAVLNRVVDHAMSRAMQNIVPPQVIQESLQKSMQNTFFTTLRAAACMMYTHEMVKDTPQILEYPPAFDTAITRIANANPEMDPQDIVAQAKEIYMKTYRAKEGVEKTKQAGRKVDVRGEQRAPGGKALPRQGTGDKSQNTTGTLSPLFNLWGNRNE